MDDLKIAQALGAVEGPLRALVAEAEGQGRIAGAAAEAERIWQVGKALAGEWTAWAATNPGLRPDYTAFLTELRKRAVPGEDIAPADPNPADYVGRLAYQGDAPPAVMPFSQMLPAEPEAVKPFDNSGATAGLVDGSGAVLPDSISAGEQGRPGVHLPGAEDVPASKL